MSTSTENNSRAFFSRGHCCFCFGKNKTIGQFVVFAVENVVMKKKNEAIFRFCCGCAPEISMEQGRVRSSRQATSHCPWFHEKLGSDPGEFTRRDSRSRYNQQNWHHSRRACILLGTTGLPELTPDHPCTYTYVFSQIAEKKHVKSTSTSA